MLIASELRKPGNSLRVMEDRARAAGHRISRSQINAYARGEVKTQPSREVVGALAAALGCPYQHVSNAARLTFPGLDEGPAEERRSSQRAEAWVRLTGDRTDAEVEELLLIVEQVLRMRDMERPNGLNKSDDGGGRQA